MWFKVRKKLFDKLGGKYLLEVSEVGYRKTCKQVKAVVKEIAKEKGTIMIENGDNFSDAWWH